MSWLPAALLGMVIWSVAAVVDKYALNGRVRSVRFYVCLPALIQFPLTLIFYPFFTPTSFDGLTVLVSLAGGILEALMLYYMFTAFSEEEVGRVFPLMSLGSALTLIGGWFILGDALESRELIAFALLLTGGFIIAIKPHAKRVRFTKAIVPILITCGLGSAYALSLRFAFLESDFATGFFFSRFGLFLGGVVILALWGPEIRKQWASLSASMRTLVIGNQVVAFGGHAFYFSALALANAALVGSVLSLQGGLIFFMAAGLSLINPKFVGESITLRDVLQKLLGIGIIAVGLNFLL